MEHIREYIVSVTAAALLCGLIRNLTGEKSASGGILKLICGIFLSLTVIRPLGQLRIEELNLFPSRILSDASLAAEEGADYARQAMVRVIKQQTEAYILDKASDYGVALRAEVIVADGDPPVPVACTITGDLSSYVQYQLAKILENDLNIPEEDQTWIKSSSKF